MTVHDLKAPEGRGYKAQHYYERVSELMAEGTSARDAFQQLADANDVSVANVKAGYARYAKEMGYATISWWRTNSILLVAFSRTNEQQRPERPRADPRCHPQGSRLAERERRQADLLGAVAGGRGSHLRWMTRARRLCVRFARLRLRSVEKSVGSEYGLAAQRPAARPRLVQEAPP